MPGRALCPALILAEGARSVQGFRRKSSFARPADTRYRPVFAPWAGRKPALAGAMVSRSASDGSPGGATLRGQLLDQAWQDSCPRAWSSSCDQPRWFAAIRIARRKFGFHRESA